MSGDHSAFTDVDIRSTKSKHVAVIPSYRDIGPNQDTTEPENILPSSNENINPMDNLQTETTEIVDQTKDKLSNNNLEHYFAQFTAFKINDYLVYLGPIKNKKFHGLGRILTTKSSTIIYEGEFYQGKYDGRGKLINYLTNTDIQEGALSGNIVSKYMSVASNNYLKDIHGDKGLLNINFSDDNWKSYIGHFRDGKKHGIGKLTLIDGRVYEGEFCAGFANGYGVVRYFGKSSCGRWKNNVLSQFL